MEIRDSITKVNLLTGHLSGEQITVTEKTLGAMRAIFEDQTAASKMDPDTVICHIEIRVAVPDGTEGGLFFATSFLMPGKVGNEFFMTKGHFHEKREAAEYYWGISGKGLLLLMDESGTCSAEKVEKGTLHYIGGNIAHRLINTGSEVLAVGACWPSDAGHNYEEITKKGFSVRVFERDGEIYIKTVRT